MRLWIVIVPFLAVLVLDPPARREGWADEDCKCAEQAATEPFRARDGGSRSA